MTAEQQTTRPHPGIIALEERIRVTRAGLESMERTATADVDAENRRLQQQIDRLQQQMKLNVRLRQDAEERLVARRAELEKLENTLDLCRTDSRVATAVWMKLLLDRKKKS